MREHEVPTHVQAEDKALLWFTFPQVVALTAVCALSYGAYRWPSEVRMGIAVLLGLAGIAAVAGKIGGRRLPLVAADLLKYRLGPRLYAGPPSELVRSEPTAPLVRQGQAQEEAEGLPRGHGRRRSGGGGRRPPGGPSAGRRGTGCGSGVRPPWTRGSASTTPSPCTAPTRPSPSRGRTRWGRPGPSPSRKRSFPFPCRLWRGSCATCA